MATINDAPECLNTNDRAMWCLGFNEAQLLIKALTAERDKLKAAFEEIKSLGIGDQMIYAHKIVDEALKESA